jgi:hypothetical protein
LMRAATRPRTETANNESALKDVMLRDGRAFRTAARPTYCA